MAGFFECAYMEREIWDFDTFRSQLAQALEDLSDCEELCSNNEEVTHYIMSNEISFYKLYIENRNDVESIRIEGKDLLEFMTAYPELKEHFMNKA